MSTLKERVLNSLKAIGIWSTAHEVYEYMLENNIDVGSSKTPDASVSSVLVEYFQKNILTYQKSDKGAGKYGFLEWNDDDSRVLDDPKVKEESLENKKEILKERSLHQLLCNYLWNKGEYSKTIYQERSNRNDTAQKWVHPDIVGVSFVDTKQAVAEELLKATKTNEAMKLCSYEIKIRIKNDYDLKQAYFQALSNSSWANYGYLVAYEIDESLQEEINRLNSAFGIGVILLQAKEIKILCPAREKELDLECLQIDKTKKKT